MKDFVESNYSIANRVIDTFKDARDSVYRLLGRETADNGLRYFEKALGTRRANYKLTSDRKMQYNKDGQLILPQQEYAMVSSARAAKNAELSESELKPVDYVYAADEFYVYENNSANDFTVKQKINIAGNEGLVNGVREVIDNGTIQSTDAVMRMVQEYKHTEGRYYRDNGRIEEAGAYGDNAGLSLGKPESDTIGYTIGDSQNNTGINNLNQTETEQGTRFFDVQNPDIRYSKETLSPEEAEEINKRNSQLYESLMDKDVSYDETKGALGENEERFKYERISNAETYNKAKAYVDERGTANVLPIILFFVVLSCLNLSQLNCLKSTETAWLCEKPLYKGAIAKRW